MRSPLLHSQNAYKNYINNNSNSNDNKNNNNNNNNIDDNSNSDENYKKLFYFCEYEYDGFKNIRNYI